MLYGMNLARDNRASRMLQPQGTPLLVTSARAPQIGFIVDTKAQVALMRHVPYKLQRNRLRINWIAVLLFDFEIDLVKLVFLTSIMTSQ